jgi:hypothetical protein
MILGNFGTTIMMRVANSDTAEMFTNCLETVKVRSIIPSTMAQSHSNGETSVSNTDVVVETNSKIVVENDLISLPKGQAFVLKNGGEIHKIRIPLIELDENLPQEFEPLIQTVNLPNVDLKELEEESILKTKKKSSDTSWFCEETDDEEPEEYDRDIFNAFTKWLSAKIASRNVLFHPNAGGLVFSESLRYGNDTVFVSESVFNKYCTASGTIPDRTKEALQKTDRLSAKMYQTICDGKRLRLYRINGIAVQNEGLLSGKIEEIKNNGNQTVH